MTGAAKTKNAARPLMAIGPFPPPVHGLAAITSAMADALEASRRVERVNLAVGRMPPDGLAVTLYHTARIWRVIVALWALVRFRAAGGRTMYQACSGGMGLAYEILLLSAARLFGLQRMVHHHSFDYVDRRSGLMAALTRVGGARMTHIFLCEGMRARFEANYGRTQALVLPNDYFVERRTAGRTLANAPLCVGFLSNLNAEKGLSDFLDLIAAAAAEGLATGVLAGPANGADLSRIKTAQQALGPALDYRGPVYKAEKAQFFADIDIFIFPTRYAHEAQPMVICEAMAVGIPVLAYDRGCIASQVGQTLHPLDRTADFTPWAMEHLHRLAADRNQLAEISAASAAKAAAAAAQGASVLARIADLP